MADRPTLIKGGWIVTMDPSLGELRDGSVLIEDGKIAAVGRDIEAPGATVVDASRAIVIPGFVDTHRHVWQAAIRGISADWSIANYLRGIRLRAGGVFRAPDMYAANYVGALEALDNGVTTVVDYCHNIVTPEHAEEAIRGLRDAGIRALWCYGFIDPPTRTPFFADFEARARLAGELAVRHFSSKDQLLTMGVAPEETPFMSEAAAKLQFRTARDLDCRVSLHLNCIREDGDPLQIAEAAGRGLLGADVLWVHMACCTEDEWKMVADSGGSVSFTPETELQMGMGIVPLEAVRAHGVNFGLGTDIVSNNSGDMFFPLRLALQLGRGMINQPKLQKNQIPEGVPITASEALRWGTIDGARTAGLDHRVGSLTPGKEADLVIVRMDTINVAAWNAADPVGNLILQAHPGQVDWVFVAGKPLKRAGRIVADEAAARAQIEQTRHYVTGEVEDLGGFMPSPDEVRHVHES